MTFSGVFRARSLRAVLAGSLLFVGVILAMPAQIAGAATPTPNWTQLTPATSPPARIQASMAYDPAIGKMVLFGGVNYRHRCAGQKPVIGWDHEGHQEFIRRIGSDTDQVRDVHIELGLGFASGSRIPAYPRGLWNRCPSPATRAPASSWSLGVAGRTSTARSYRRHIAPRRRLGPADGARHGATGGGRCGPAPSIWTG